jgi:hydroxymethylbilane synthase
VHSMKDLPTRIPDALIIAAIPEREDAREALIAKAPVTSIAALSPGSVIGTGSVRRQAQILSVRQDLRIVDIRGNVDTRLRKVSDGQCDAIILACAGLNRLGLSGRIQARISLAEMLPAPGQGALALETRKDDLKTQTMIASLNHLPTATAVSAERAFLRRMGGGCNSPVAVHGTAEGERLRIDGMIASPDGKKVVRDCVSVPHTSAEEMAVELAEKILAAGGQEILRLIS